MDRNAYKAVVPGKEIIVTDHGGVHGHECI